MYLVLLVLLVPINLAGIAALVASARSKSAAWLIGLAIPSLLGAATGSVLGGFGSAEMDRQSRSAIAVATPERRAVLEHDRDEVARIYVATGAVGTLLPWLGGILALRRARRLDT